MSKKTVLAAPSDLGDRMIRFKISDETQDRDEDIMIAAGCDFTNFAKNPQFLGFHNYFDFPLGTPKKWWIDQAQKAVYADVYFPTIEELSTNPEQASEKAKLVDTTYHMYKTGMLSAVSIGFNPIQSTPNPSSDSGYGKIIKKWELYEFSAVPVPANPNAIQEGIKSGKITKAQAAQMEVYMQKGAIPYHKYPLAPADEAWDGPAEVAKASVDDLKKMCAWMDPENEDVKTGYKLPHHTQDGYKTVKRAVVAAMGALLGARGGVDIPEADKDAVKAHLAKHYAEFGLDVPDDKSAWDMQVKSLGLKVGARFSAETKKTLDSIKSTHAEMQKSLDKAAMHQKKAAELHAQMGEMMKDLIGQDEPDDDGDEEEDDLTSEKSVIRIVG